MYTHTCTREPVCTLDGRVVNDETMRAIEEVEEMAKHPHDFTIYTDVHKMFEELLST